MAPPGATLNKVLLVEGSNDKHVIEHLYRQAGRLLDFEVTACGNVQELLKRISVEMKAPGRTALGVLADANSNIGSRWREVSRELAKVDVQLSANPVSGGTILSDEIRVGVWLMPDNVNNGELEDFLMALIPSSDVLWPFAQRYIGSIPANVQPMNLSKAEVHAWLAGKPQLLLMGQAISSSRGYFDTNVPLARSLVAWLDQIFV